MILRKLEYYKEGGSEKHREDIRGMLEVSGDTLVGDALMQWIDDLGVAEAWAGTVAGTGFSHRWQ